MAQIDDDNRLKRRGVSKPTPTPPLFDRVVEPLERASKKYTGRRIGLPEAKRDLWDRPARAAQEKAQRAGAAVRRTFGPSEAAIPAVSLPKDETRVGPAVIQPYNLKPVRRKRRVRYGP